LETLSGIKEYDIMFKDKIKVNSIGFFVEGDKEGSKVDNKLVEKYIIGVKEFKCISWEEKLEKVKKCIDENDKRPSYCDKNRDIKILGQWISHQQTNYKSKEYIIKNSNIYDKWTEFITSEKYKKYFMSNEEEWQSKLTLIKKYIDENNKTPSKSNKNKNIRALGIWISNQQTHYKSKEHIMKNPDIYSKWTEFITSEKYKKYFMSNEEELQSNLNLIKKYIDENDKRPSNIDKNKDIKTLGSWLLIQQNNYKSKKYIMKNSDIYDKWTVFVTSEKYKKYFMSNEEEWQSNLNLIKKYIDENDKRPSYKNKNKNTKILGKWLSHQVTNYKSKEYIMKNPDIYDKWTVFITSEKYKKYFMSNEEEWHNIFSSVKTYIDENDKRPSSVDKNKDIKTLGQWIVTQQGNYKSKEQIMKNSDIYDKWTVFITSEKYKKYFMSNEEDWQSNLNLIKKYIDENDKRPSACDKNRDIKTLGQWISHQQTNYKSKEQIMKNPDIYDKWTGFINDLQYSPYFD
jgi:antitoxin component HigA of HigAB toxin-antitoxin module